MFTRIRILVFPLLLFPGFSVALADTETRGVDTQVVIAASPGDVLQAFLSDDDLKAWWKVSRSLVEPDMPILGPMQLDIAVSPRKAAHYCGFLTGVTGTVDTGTRCTTWSSRVGITYWVIWLHGSRKNIRNILNET